MRHHQILRRAVTVPRLLAILFSVIVLLGCRQTPESHDPQVEGTLLAVDGPLPADSLGFALPHEHVLVDFAGASLAGPHRYDADSAFHVILPHLLRARSLGVDALFEATPAWLGRDPQLLLRLSHASGVRLFTNTGYYAARNAVHLPRHAFVETPEAIASRWIGEFENGIEGTGIRPGFIKIGLDNRPLSDTTRALVRAAAFTHLATGLTIASHTGTAGPAEEQLALLEEAGVHPSAWIWVHAQNEPDLPRIAAAARRGSWISFDGLDSGNVHAYVERIRFMRDEALLDRVLVSHDAGWYSAGEPGGGTFRGYETLISDLIPALREAGFTEVELDGLFRRNPAEAYAVRIRSLAD